MSIKPNHLLDYLAFGNIDDADISIIWMHGLGADGHDFSHIPHELLLPSTLSTHIVLPHAPTRPVTLYQGQTLPAWYDILGLSADSREDHDGLHTAAKQIEALIHNEISHGRQSKKIFLAGFSQGGALALYCGLRFALPLGGIIALSSYLPVASQLQQDAHPANKTTPIFIGHGTRDTIVPFSWGELSHRLLKEQGYQCSWHHYPMPHTVCGKELNDIGRWIEKQL